MVQSLMIAVNAVVPFTIYILYGYLAGRAGLVRKGFFKELNTMLFKLMMPFVTFYNIYNSDISDLPSAGLIIFSIASLLILELLLLIIVPRIISGNPQRGVIIQAIYRSNFILFALPLVLSIYGDSAGSVTAMIVTLVVALYNITSVIILEIFNQENTSGSGEPARSRTPVLAKGIALNVIKNPLLEGAIAGIIFMLIGIKLPSGVETAVKAFSNLATPMALFVLGGTLDLGIFYHNLRYLVPVLTFKLVLLPLVMVVIAYMIGLRTLELFIVVAMYGTPVAVASYTMAQNMGGDGELAGHFVFLSTIVSVFTLMLWIFSFDRLGLLF